MNAITIEDFVTAVRLVKKDTCQSYATTQAIARMLGAKKMDVLLFMEENPRLLHVSEHFKPKYVKVRIGGETWTQERRGASLGLCVDEAYATPEENPWNPEWLAGARQRYAKTLWLSNVNNYDQIIGRCFNEDMRPSGKPDGFVFDDNRENTWLWRNTKEKLEAAKALGACAPYTFWKGGFSDSYKDERPYAVSAKGLSILKDNGYNIIAE